MSLIERFDYRCLLNGQEIHVEVKGTTSEGERVLLTRKALFLDSQGHELLVGSITDITEAKLATQALERSRRFLEDLINAVPNPLFVKDRQHRWVLVNDAFCRMTLRPRRGFRKAISSSAGTTAKWRTPLSCSNWSPKRRSAAA